MKGTVDFAPPDDDEYIDTRNSLLQTLGYGTSYEWDNEKEEIISAQMVETARILVADHRELYEAEARLVGGETEMKTLSPRNERSALSYIESRLVQAMASSKADADASRRVRNACGAYLSALSTAYTDAGRRFPNSTQTTPVPDPDRHAFERLAAAVGDESAVRASISNSDTSGRRLLARENIMRGETVFAIPKRMVLCPSLVRESVYGKRLRAHLGEKLRKICGDSESEEDVLLALYLLGNTCEEEKDKWFTLYRQLLPKEQCHMFTFSEKACSILSDTDIPAMRDWSLSHLKYVYEHIVVPHSDVFPEEEFTFPKFVLAKSLVDSRAMRIPPSNSPSLTRTTALVPLVDMANHNAVEAAVLLPPQWNHCDTMLEFRACRNIQEGEEIFFQYGSLGNADLLQYHGFCPQDNPYEFLEIVFDGGDDDELAVQKELVFAHLRLPIVHYVSFETQFVDLLFAAACVFSAAERDFQAAVALASALTHRQRHQDRCLGDEFPSTREALRQCCQSHSLNKSGSVIQRASEALCILIDLAAFPQRRGENDIGAETQKSEIEVLENDGEDVHCATQYLAERVRLAQGAKRLVQQRAVSLQAALVENYKQEK